MFESGGHVTPSDTPGVAKPLSTSIVRSSNVVAAADVDIGYRADRKEADRAPSAPPSAMTPTKGGAGIKPEGKGHVVARMQ